jgi:hypothetical protein
MLSPISQFSLIREGLRATSEGISPCHWSQFSQPFLPFLRDMSWQRFFPELKIARSGSPIFNTFLEIKET